MNIEEAKELVDNSKFYGKTSSVIKAEVRDIIDQLNQPKPEVPQYVADWIEECEEEGLTLKGLFSNSDMPAKILIGFLVVTKIVG
ncbi:phage protein [Streptococcus pyogenes]|nr:phage protein [Streptococcus pyogenes]